MFGTAFCADLYPHFEGVSEMQASSSEFHAFRKGGIGGSDIAAILGLSPWTTPVDVWAEKTGRVTPQAETIPMRMGRILEPAVMDLYEEDTGALLERSAPPLVVDAILRGNVDAINLTHGRIVEAKTASSGDGWGAPGTDEVPAHYLAQVLWYCGLADLPGGDIPLLIAARDFRIYRVDADQETFEGMREAAQKFWRDHVLADVPPAPRTAADALTLWPRSQDGKSIEVSPEIARDVEAAKALKSAIKAQEAKLETLEARIRIAFGDAEQLSAGGKLLATFKSQESQRLDQKALAAANPEIFNQFRAASQMRVLRLK